MKNVFPIVSETQKRIRELNNSQNNGRHTCRKTSAFLHLVVGNYYHICGGIKQTDEHNQDILWNYDSALSYFPQYLLAHNSRGYILYTMGRFLDALSSFKKAIALHPFHIRTYNNAGYVLLAMGNYEESIEYQCSALAICRNQERQFKGNPSIYWNPIDLYELRETAHRDKALAEYALATKYNPVKFIQTPIWTNEEEIHRLFKKKKSDRTNTTIYEEKCSDTKLEQIENALKHYFNCFEDGLMAVLCCEKTNNESNNNKNADCNIVGKTLHSIARIFSYAECFNETQQNKIINHVCDIWMSNEDDGLNNRISLKMQQLKHPKTVHDTRLKTLKISKDDTPTNLAKIRKEYITLSKDYFKDVLTNERTNILPQQYNYFRAVLDDFLSSLYSASKKNKNKWPTDFLKSWKSIKETILEKPKDKQGDSNKAPTLPEFCETLKIEILENQTKEDNRREITDEMLILLNSLIEKCENEQKKILAYLKDKGLSRDVVNSLCEIPDIESRLNSDTAITEPENNRIEAYEKAKNICTNNDSRKIDKDKYYLIFSNVINYKKIQSTHETICSLFARMISHDSDFRFLAGNYSSDFEFCHLWFYQKYLLRLLRLEKSDFLENEISSYRTVNALEGYLGDLVDLEHSTKRNSFSLYSTASMNDHQEGLALQEFFGIRSQETQDKLFVLCSSFSPDSNNLTMFRLYGRAQKESSGKTNGNIEGTGVSIVFDERFFNVPTSEVHLLRVQPETDSIQKNSWKTFQFYTPALERNSRNREGKSANLPLYRVLYYNKENESFIYHPSHLEDRILKNGKISSDIDDNWAERKSMTFKKERAIGDVLKKMKDVFEKIRTKGNTDVDEKNYRRCENVESGYRERDALILKSKAALNLLIYVRYLVKDSAFADEKEIRMLTLRDYDDAIERSPKNASSRERTRLKVKYLHVVDSNNPLVKVVLGPKVEDANNKILLWKQTIAQYFANENDRIKKDFEKILDEELILCDESEKNEVEKRRRDYLAADTPSIKFVQSLAPLA